MYLIASRHVTPEHAAAFAARNSATSFGRFFDVARSTQPIALRMNNSVSPSIGCAISANNAKSPRSWVSASS
jgi:hypothetical protein